jgi:Ca2+-binding RTX toxin-like protein
MFAATGRTASFAVGLLALIAAFVPGVAAASTCTYSPQTKVVTITLIDEWDTRVVRVGKAIVFRRDNDLQSCGAAKVSNTNRVVVTGTGASSDTISANYFTIDESGGRLGPGATRERKGKSEIEVRIDITPGTNPFPPGGPFPLELDYVGTSGPDVVRLGAKGMDLNGDGDVDVRTVSTPFDQYAFLGAEGPDVLSGAGSRATGAAVPAPITLWGAGGKDRLTGGRVADVLDGGPGADELRGGAGPDRLIGGSGADRLFGGSGDDIVGSATFDGPDSVAGGAGFDWVDYTGRSAAVRVSLDRKANDGRVGERDNVGVAGDVEGVLGGNGDDVIVGNPARNILKGAGGADTITGKPGQDDLFGEAGNDTLFALDGIADLVDGGADEDTAEVDVGLDTVVGVEFSTLRRTGRIG